MDDFETLFGDGHQPEPKVPKVSDRGYGSWLNDSEPPKEKHPPTPASASVSATDIKEPSRATPKMNRSQTLDLINVLLL